LPTFIEDRDVGPRDADVEFHMVGCHFMRVL
jgi:hypothetical protein